MSAAAFAVFLGAVILLIILICLRVPVAFALIGTSAIGLAVASGMGIAERALGSSAFGSTADYALAVIPLFVLMGAFAARAGLAGDLFDVIERHTKKLPGGLAIAGISASAGFAAITGSSVATVASIGKTAIEEMRSHGYDVRFAAGSVAIAGTLGIMIPPSVALVLYGIVTGTSIGQLLIAGVVPGIVSAILYALVAIILATRRPELAGGASRAARSSPTSPPVAIAPAWDNKKYWSVVKVAVLFGIVIVGVYSGVYTATEAGAIGAFAAVLLLLFTGQRDGSPRLRALGGALLESTRLTSSVFLIVVGGALLTFLMVRLGVPAAFAEWAGSLPVPGWTLVVVLLLIMVPLGMFLDSISIILVFIPVVFPVVEALGYNPIVFGILAIKLIEIGMVTPPVGMNAFVIASSVPGVRAEDAFRGVLPFLLADVAFVILIMMVPDIVLFLPNAMVS
ncbi:TRAP transporter large permease [Microbacterium pseudoresistens]|uniref:Tripartite ATP-independent transporter DctM subunit n=1 Tax=Microbacterium pseudoresistens TaxID=640634 RepID=A0A7Y9ETQ0_9MICO|nr:TRAP transporter large permease [Microbacterium pseudoresistens]NYD53611.1 tripartite ATP-independent transporter DctM subunit [Microbacterium pseudoresistens]